MNAFRLTPTPSARTVPTPRHRFLWKKKGSVRPTCSRRRKDWRHWFSAGVAGYPGFVEASPRGLVSCAQLLDRVSVDAFVRAFRCSGFGRSQPWPWRTAATACMNRSFVSSTSTSASVDPRSCPRLPSVPFMPACHCVAVPRQRRTRSAFTAAHCRRYALERVCGSSILARGSYHTSTESSC